MAGIVTLVIGSFLAVWGFRTAAISRDRRRRVWASVLGPVGLLLVGLAGYLLGG